MDDCHIFIILPQGFLFSFFDRAKSKKKQALQLIVAPILSFFYFFLIFQQLLGRRKTTNNLVRKVIPSIVHLFYQTELF